MHNGGINKYLPGCVVSEMTVIRPIDTEYGTLKGCHVDEMLQKHWGSTHTVKVFREPNKSLGISIVGGKVDLHSSEKSSDAILGIFVKGVVPNSPAGKTGQFKTGDRILEVSGVDLRQASHEKAVQAIRNATNPVTFVVQSLIPWHNAENNTNSINNENNCPSPFPSPASLTAPVNIEELKSTSPDRTKRLESNLAESTTEQPENVSIPTPPARAPPTRPSESVGKVPFPSEKPPTVQVQSPPKVRIVPEGQPSKDVQPPELPSTSAAPPSSSQVVSDEEVREEGREVNLASDTVEGSEEEDEDEDEDDVREMEGRTVSAKGEQIDRASAANVKRTKEEIQADPEEEDDFGYTMNKVKKKYASLGHTILMVQLERSNQGLGLSLAGHKDRNCMAVFVCGLNPNGAAYKAGGIQIGDEILEVNGVVLHGRCHLNASAIIKGLSGPIFKVIILRRKTAIDDIAVKPITQFPVSLAEEATEEQFSAKYPNVRTVTIKKQVNQSLGIMIIEGRHAEVGHGIFISDIQKDGPAEKAGIIVGEMILAVNKDSLVGTNHDTATNILRRTEGLVSLVISNPGGKQDTKQEPPSSPKPTTSAAASAAGAESSRGQPATLKPVGPSSRPTTPVPEPVPDPSNCAIVPGRETTIEIATENMVLGTFFVGGKDTATSNGIILVEVYPGGAAAKDGRLQPGDQIMDVNGTSLKDVTYTSALIALRQTLPKMKMTVYRPTNIEYTVIEVDMIRKPGKGLGLSVISRKSGRGVYVSEVLTGGAAEADGKIARGDLLISVNGQDLENSTGEEAGAKLKTATGKVSLKLHRYKITTR